MKNRKNMAFMSISRPLESFNTPAKSTRKRDLRSVCVVLLALCCNSLPITIAVTIWPVTTQV